MEYSPSQYIGHSITVEQGSTAGARAEPDYAEADGAVAQSAREPRGVDEVQKVSNMSNPGEHRGGS